MLYNLTLLLPCAMCLIGTAFLICKRKSNTKAQNILILCFLLSGVFFFCTANYIGGISDYVTYRWVNILDCLFTPFTIPFIYLYFRAFTYEGRFVWKDYVWFLPAFIIGISTCVLYLAMDEKQTAGYVQSVLMNQWPEAGIYKEGIYKLHHFITVELYSFFILVQIFGTVTCAIVYLKRYHYRLREFYSALDDKSMDLDNTILFWFMLAIPFALCVTLTKETFWREYPVITSLFFTGYATVCFGTCYYACQRKYTVENLAYDMQQADSELIQNNLGLTEKEDSEDDADEIIPMNRYAQYLKSFQKLMDEDHIFLQSDLRSGELATKMGTNRTYLSRMFREELKCTFSDYINQKRIEYAQKLMRKNPRMRLSDLAEHSGFANINSFGRTFKQFTGSSPKEWLKNNVSSL